MSTKTGWFQGGKRGGFVALVGLALLGLFAFPIPAGAVEVDETVSSLYDKLPGTVVSPHTTWAKPYARGTIKVLVIAPTWSHRETVELAQRMDVEYRPLMVGRFDRLYTPETVPSYNIGVSHAKPETVDQVMEERLKENYDAIILGKVFWNVFPTRVKYEILRKVKEDGTGLIYISPRECQQMEIVFTQKPVADEQAFVKTGIPLEALPVLQALTPDFLTLSEFGQGRVVKLDYGQPESSPWLSLTPTMDTQEGQAFAYDYYHSLLAKALIWVSRREPSVFIKKLEWGEKGSSPATLKGELLNADPQAKTVEVELAVRDRDNQVEHTQHGASLTLKPGTNDFSFRLPRLKEGLHLVDVWIKEGEKTLNWGSTFATVESLFRIEKLVLDKAAYHLGDTVQGQVVFNQPVENLAVNVQLWDNFGRLMSEKRMMPAGAEAAFSWEISEARSILLKVKATLWDHERVLSEKAVEFPVAAKRPTNDFFFVMWHAYSPNDYLGRLITRQFYDLGVDAGFPPPDTAYARVAAGSNLSSVPYLFGTFGSWGSAEACQDNLRKPCLNDPAYREDLKKTLETCIPFLRDIGNPADNLTIQGALTRSNQEFCFCPLCVKGFQEYVREDYGTLEALNKEWDTAYGSWEEIKPVTLAEAREKGHFAQWVDFRIYMEAVFTDLHAYLKKEIQTIDPEAVVGFNEPQDATSTRGISWWKLLSAVDMCGLYVNPGARHTDVPLEIVRSFLKNGRKGTITGGWIGCYGYTENFNRAMPWRILFHEGDSIWDWMGYDAYGAGGWSALTPDLAPLPYFVTAMQEINEIKRGVGKLLLSSQREHDGIAIHYSPLSVHASTLTGTTDIVDCQRSFVHVLEDLGLQYNFVSNEQIEQGELVNKQYKVLCLPQALAMSAGEAEKIREFVSDGGTVLADYTPGIMDRHGKALNASPLAEVFGGFSTELKTQACGKGKAVYLDQFLADYSALRREGQEAAKRDKVERILKLAGIEPRLKITTASRERLGAVETVFFKNGEANYVCLLRDYTIGESRPEETVREARLTFRSKAHVYDVRAGKYLGHTDRIRSTIALGRAKVFALLPYRVERIGLKLDRKEYQPGEVLSYQVRVQGSRNNLSTHGFRFDLLNPQGEEVRPYSENLLAQQGRYSGQVRLSLNEEKGPWRLRVKEVASGTVVEQSFRVDGTSERRSQAEWERQGRQYVALDHARHWACSKTHPTSKRSPGPRS